MPGRNFKIIVIIHIALNLFVGGLFLKYSTQEDRYGGPDCVYLRYSSFIFALITLTAVIIQEFIVLFTQNEEDLEENYLRFYMIYLFISFISLIFLFALLLLNEPCGDLRNLVFTFFEIIIFLLQIMLTKGGSNN